MNKSNFWCRILEHKFPKGEGRMGWRCNCGTGRLYSECIRCKWWDKEDAKVSRHKHVLDNPDPMPLYVSGWPTLAQHNPAWTSLSWED